MRSRYFILLAKSIISVSLPQSYSPFAYLRKKIILFLGLTICISACDDDKLLSDLMNDAWLAFAQAGQPTTNQVTWPSYRGESTLTNIDNGKVLRWKVTPELALAPIREGRCSSMNDHGLIP